MKKVAVISSIYGDFDTMIPPADQDMPCEWIMITDRRQECPPWRVTVEPRPHLRPSFAGKVARARPDLYSDADILIWADGNLRIHSSGFVSWCVAQLGEAPLAAKDTRAERAGMRDEANVAAAMWKYEGQPVKQQAEHYIAEGFPDDWGRWWTGLIVRTRDCPNFGDAWLTEMARWSCECQISLPYVLWKYGLWPAPMPVTGEHFTIRPHAK